jgi:CubicO group peptidase (beta-lactamase class C family)
MRIIVFFLLLFSVLTARAQSSFDTSALVRDNRGIYSLVIAVKDSIIYNRTFNGKQADDLFNNQSLTKNICAVLIGIAIDKGFIPSLEVPVADFLPELRNDPDKRKQLITLKDIMNQASGLWHENLERLNIYLGMADPSGYVMKQPLLSDPGSELHYNNAASHLLSVILTKATGLTTLDFARKYLFDPLDIQRVAWSKMKDGYYDGGGLLSVQMSTADVNKLGRLLLNNGRYKNKPVVSQKWVQLLLTPVKTYPAPWGLHNTTYGLCFYHTTFKGTAILYGMGWGGQFLILIPAMDAVVSVNQAVDDRSAIRQSAVFMEEIFPMIFDWIQRERF